MTDITEKIHAAILDFHWWNYGLDNVSEAEKDWATDLADEIATAIGQGERITTRKPSDLWQAVLITDGGRVVEPDALGADDGWAICVVRRSLAPVGDPRMMPDPDDPEPEDIAHYWQCEDSDDSGDDPDDDVAQRYAMAQAMARGLNAAEAVSDRG
jgi:hypothetical protein